jgi:predicted enzyme related to lactoylglutathione lyase
VPYLIVSDGFRAVEWYVANLGATRRGEAIVMADGRVGHVELELRGSVLYLADASAESHVAAPRPGDGATVSLTLEVPDVDRAVDRAVTAGAELERPAVDNPYGRNAVIRDPFGHRWILSAAPVAPGSPGAGADGPDPARFGDIGYVSLWVPDEEKAAAFFSRVLGWSYASEPGGPSHQVSGRMLNHGIHGGHDRGTLFLCFMIEDVGAGIDRVRTAGGWAGEPTEEPWGLTVMCRDIEDSAFALYQPPPGAPGLRLVANGSRQGDVAYVTVEVRNSAAARSFYGQVLGWRFTPGHVEDGWSTDDVVPMTGLSGGHEASTVVPMYRVDDIHVAVARVRGAGGTATDPERQPYGVSSQCVDDQGTRFSLGQL